MSEEKLKIAVLGDGGWGTALALTARRNGHQVKVWGKFQENVDSVNRNHENTFLKGVPIPEDLTFTCDMAETVREAQILVLASPSQYLRGTLTELEPLIDRKNQYVMNIAKGIETGTLLRMSELCRQILGKTKYIVFSGPSHAEEVSRNVPTAVVAASPDQAAAEFVQSAFMNEYLRVYTSSDIIGVELGGALKNIFAITAGVIDGIGLGDNTKAAMMTRAIAEMSRLGEKLGGLRQTFNGLSGIGDLIVTCMSRHSRNRYVGEQLGKGITLDEIIRSMHMVVAEGVDTCTAAKKLSQEAGVETPIIDATYAVLHGHQKPLDVLYGLMTRKAKPEL